MLIDYITRKLEKFNINCINFSQRHFNKITYFTRNVNRRQRKTHWFVILTKSNIKTNNARQNVEKTIFESNSTQNMISKNDFFHSIRNKTRSILFTKIFSLNNLKRTSRFNETQTLSKRIIYFNMFQYANHNKRNI